MSTCAAMSGTLATIFCVVGREEVDHPARAERDLAQRLGRADGERLEEVSWASHAEQATQGMM